MLIHLTNPRHMIQRDPLTVVILGQHRTGKQVVEQPVAMQTKHHLAGSTGQPITPRESLK